MITKQITPTEEQTAAREAVAAAISEAAARVLAGWEDDRLLGQPRARTIVQVTRAVRVQMGRDNPELVARVTSWRLRKLLEERIPPSVSRAQGVALRRRMEAEGEPPLEYEFVAGESANGDLSVGVTLPESPNLERQPTWSADE